MRLKSFSGATMTEAMRQVREALGDNAIIVATREDEAGGVRVTAAIDDPVAPAQSASLGRLVQQADTDALEIIAKALVRHQIPATLGERLLATATQYAQDDPLLSVGAALDTHFTYTPLPDTLEAKRLILIGPPGAGKTLCAAKLATKATMSKTPVVLISTDTARAGGMAQLDAFARVLKTEIVETEDPHALQDAIEIQKPNSFVLIDTAGCNPFDDEERQTLAATLRAAKAQAILVLPADLDSSTALELAKEFQNMGAQSILATRLDIARQLGSLLRASYETKIPLADFSATAKVTQPPQPFNPVSLARLLLSSQTNAQSAPKATGTHSL